MTVAHSAIHTEARRAIEAMVLVASEPLPDDVLAQVVELPVDEVAALCQALAAEYEEQQRGFQLIYVAGGWRYQTHPDMYAYVERYALEGMPNRISSAALETLAIVAYKQPISRSQIAAIRGVNVDGVLRTLEQRGYVIEVDRDTGPGQAVLFGTTPFFLERLGLANIDQLPALGDFVPSAEVLEALENTLRISDDEDPVVEANSDDAEADDVEADGAQADDVEADDAEADDVEMVTDADETAEVPPSPASNADDAPADPPTAEANGDEPISLDHLD